MLCFGPDGRTIYGVAPHAGARIEMSVSVRASPNMAVAPHAGARIEMWKLASRSSMEIVAPHAGARIEMFCCLILNTNCLGRTSRRCANRNRTKDGIEVKGYKSHPARVRESKCPRGPSADTRRTSRRCENRNLDYLVSFLVSVGSHLTQVRESKSGKCDYLGNPNVAPHAGARIEIV